jgi:Rod binding domain-containing protein
MSLSPVASVPASSPGTFNAAAIRRAEPAAQRAAVAGPFEAVLVRQLLGETMKSMVGGGAGGVSGSIYGDMLADTISQKLTAGPGLGLGRYIEKQLTPRGEKTGADALPAAATVPQSS